MDLEKEKKKNVTKETRIGGWITNIQDFVVHDGPGLRIIVFLKGCQLRCGWCQNPGNIQPDIEIEYHASLCLECLNCLNVCPIPGAIIKDKNQRIDRNKCNKCMACVNGCLGRALRSVGEWISVEDLMKMIIKYRPFFNGSDRGGVTLSGGDPTFQPEFTLSLLQSCKEERIHTVVETCGYAKYDTLKNIVANTNLLIFDIKHMDELKHIKGTGKSNKLILDNLEKLCQETDTEIVIHIPLIPGFNDDEENITKSAEFISSLKKIKHVDLLPFNELASGSYKALGLDWEYNTAKRQPQEQLIRLKGIIESYGLEANIGGLW
jgi:pyruvate formate lyase activating enzyme